MKHIYIITILLLCIPILAKAQQGIVYVTENGSIHGNGDITLVNTAITNFGIVNEQGIITFKGDVYDEFIIRNISGAYLEMGTVLLQDHKIFTFEGDIRIGTLNKGAAAYTQLQSSNIEILDDVLGENLQQSIIGGTSSSIFTYKQNFTAPTSLGNVGLSIVDADALPTEIYVKRTYRVVQIEGVNSVSKIIEVQATAPENMNATVNFAFYEEDLVAEGYGVRDLALYRSEDLVTWEFVPTVNIEDTAFRWQATGVNEFSYWTLAPVGLLPVELLYFTAEAIQHDSELKWETVTEINNERFEVEYSTDGVNFEYLTTIAGQGTTNEATEYKHIHQNAAQINSLLYYRLKQVDFDGTSTYSDIQVVTFEEINQLSIFPNPAPAGSVISVLSNSKVNTYEVYNAQGKIVLIGDANNQKSFTISTNNLASGIYILRLNDASTHKIVIE